ncbi:MAG: NACHT domain-containing protein [Alphaproteobacteria bacterium]|nr:NACHT domain-containing protein [Alphaproteobacteria bacterium]
MPDISSSFVDEATKSVLSRIVSLADKQIGKFLVDFEAGFQNYLIRNVEKCSSVKTLLYKSEPVDIAEAYVPPRFSISESEFSEKELRNFILDNKYLIVSGIAGTGKSMFMKNFIVESTKDISLGLPVFVELRYAYRSKSDTIKSYIVDQIESFIPDLSVKALNYALEQGKFVLVFDGFDEVSQELREKCEQEILSISYKYPKCQIIVSSRPDNRFDSWQEFHVANIMPFSIDECCSLVKKLRYDEVIKEKFLERIQGGLYDSHTNFLSNPLLTTMMLLTFEEFAEIPSKMHLFYEQAFETLYRRHDLSKPTYNRKFNWDCSSDEFKKAFAAFSAYSYLDGVHSFDEKTIQKYAGMAMAILYHDGHEEKFVKDLIDSVCALIRDGDHITFIHRSFQEYFCALFLVDRDSDDRRDYLDLVLGRSFFDSVIVMFHDIAPNIFENEYFSDKVRDIHREIWNTDLQENPLRILRLFISSIDIEPDSLESLGFSWGSTKKQSERQAILRLCRHIYGGEIGTRKNAIRREDLDNSRLISKATMLEKQRKDGFFEIPVKNMSNKMIKSSVAHNHAFSIYHTIVAVNGILESRRSHQSKLLSEHLAEWGKRRREKASRSKRR